jgi:pyruvate dehydrogenase E2 component (dihydrolipoamide acetyltransferase)
MAAETFEFTMPSLGADMDEGKLVEWLVKPGDVIAKGDLVAVVETAKAAIEVECFRSGVIDELIVAPGATVPVGAPLATMSAVAPLAAEPPSEEAEAPPAPLPAAAPAPAPAAAAAAVPAPTAGPLIRRLAASLGVDLAAVEGTGRQGQITRADVQRAAAARPPAPAPEPPTREHPPPAGMRVSPYTARLATELGIDLATVHGTGRDGAIRSDDVRAAAAAPQPPAEPGIAAPAAAPKPAEVDAQRQAAAQRAEAARLTTARLMARSKREIPHYYLRTDIDMTDALAMIRERNRELPVAERILPAALFLRATALAVVKVSELNGFWEDDHFIPGATVNLGVPVSLRGGGLITPALIDVAELGLTELAVRMRDLATRAKAGRLRGAEMTAATITVTNLGDLGVELVYGVIYPPQVALVGVGKIVERPWAVNGLLGIRSVATVTLSADHRATDGHTGARFLDAIGRSLSQPENL